MHRNPGAIFGQQTRWSWAQLVSGPVLPEPLPSPEAFYRGVFVPVIKQIRHPNVRVDLRFYEKNDEKSIV